MTHWIECSRKQNPLGELWVRSGPVPNNADQRLYDLGLFQIATSGQQTPGGQLGELWVSYEIELLKPRILPGTGGNFNGSGVFDHIQIYNSTLTTPGVTPARPFGTSSSPLYPTSQSTLGGVVTGAIVAPTGFVPQNQPTGNNFLGGIALLNASGQPTGILGSSTANTYYFPPGVSSGIFMVLQLIGFAATPSTYNFAQTFVNCQSFNLFTAAGGAGDSNWYQLPGGTPANFNVIAGIQVTAPNASFAITSSATNTVPSGADLFVIKLAITQAN